MKTLGTDLLDLACKRTLHLAAQFAAKANQPIDHKLFIDHLQAAVKAGYSGLLSDMHEANQAFHGNEHMLNQVLNVACLQFVATAWGSYNEARAGLPMNAVAV